MVRESYAVNSSVLDNDPFGMILVGRSWEGTSAENYRFGFNGQEQDDDLFGNGNITTAEFWEYDTRLGRRWNIDPITIPSFSPYMAFDDNPLLFNDILGSKVSYGGGDGSKSIKKEIKWQKRHDKNFRKEWRGYKRQDRMFIYFPIQGTNISISNPEVWSRPKGAKNINGDVIPDDQLKGGDGGVSDYLIYDHQQLMALTHTRYQCLNGIQKIQPF